MEQREEGEKEKEGRGEKTREEGEKVREMKDKEEG